MPSLRLTKQRVRDRWIHALARSRWYKLGTPGLTILGYHQVTEEEPNPIENFDGASISKKRFEQQLSILSRHYNVISLTDWPAAKDQYDLQPCLAITFDDGYADNASIAWPILRRLGFPATFFITTGLLDGTLRTWSDQLRAAIVKTRLKTLDCPEVSNAPIPIEHPAEKIRCLALLAAHLKQTDDVAKQQLADEWCRQCEVDEVLASASPMSWDELRTMSQQGAEIGGHTTTHPILSRIPAEKAECEIAGCKRKLEEELDKPITAFAYPNGTATDFNTTSIEMVAKAGYETAVTTIPGINRHDKTPSLQLGRFVVNGNQPLERLLRRLRSK